MSLDFDSDIQNRLETIDVAEINYRYEQEENLMDAVSRGSFEEYLEVIKMKNAPQGFDVRVTQRDKHDYLRSRKNGLLTRKTIMRVAAKRGGVPPVYLHIISEKYAILIEQATSTAYLDQVLADEMARGFCNMVKDYSMKGYTPAIQEVILYIDAHLSQRLSVQEVAAALHFHPSYLSRKFKQETGRNLTDYVNHQRIEYAKMLFQTGKTNVTNVALSCGYGSSSYFSKVFKKYTDTYPSDYLKQIEENGD